MRPLGAVRRPEAVRWGQELRRALRQRDLTQAELARRAGCSAQDISFYASGRTLPSMARAVRLSDVLMWPHLAELRTGFARRLCGACGREFVSGGNRPDGRFCGRQCTRAAYLRVRRELADEKRVITSRRLRTFEAAVAAMCGDCEPEGVCRTRDCPLRRVSPLPLVARRVA